MKNFVFEIPVRLLLLSKEWSNNLCDDLAKKIALYYFERRSGDEIIMNFIFIIISIDLIRNKSIGRNREIGRVNLFSNLIGEYAAYMLIGDTRASKRIAAECAKAAPSGTENFISMKLKSLLTKVKQVERMSRYFDEVYPKISKNIEIFDKKFSSEKQSINQVFDELLQMRKYGVKSSAFQENIIAAPGDYWIISPSDYLLTMYQNDAGAVGWQLDTANKMVRERIVSSVSISNRRNIEVTPVPLTLDSGEGTCMLATDSKSDFGIDFKGELVIQSGVADMNLREYFTKRGQSELYEMLRANAIFRLYDLVVPTYVEKAYSVPRFPERGLVGMLFPKNSSFDPKLYLQRIRILFDNLIHINKGLELEYEESLSAKPSQQLKREHDVVCHIRKLGNGYQPSERARKLAREVLNYELKDGETFVMKHSRGKGGVKSDNLHLAVKKH